MHQGAGIALHLCHCRFTFHQCGERDDLLPSAAPTISVLMSEKYECVQLVTDGEGPIELLDDDDEEEGYDEEGQVVEYDEAGNPIVTEYVEVDGGDYEEGEGAEGEQCCFLMLPYSKALLLRDTVPQAVLAREFE